MGDPLTPNDIATAAEMIIAVGEAIRDLTATSPLGGVPSGELYVRLAPLMSLAAYESIVRLLVLSGYVKRKPSHLLVWIGPTAPPTNGGTMD